MVEDEIKKTNEDVINDPEVKDVFEEIKKFNLVQLNKLVSQLEKEFKVSAGMALSGGSTPNQEKAQTPDKVSVIVKSFSPTEKVHLIQAFRQYKGNSVSISDAMKTVNSLPFKFAEGVSQEEVKKIKEILAPFKGIEIEIK